MILIWGGPLALGMHQRGSFYDIAGIETCQIMTPDMRMAAMAVLDHFSKLNIPFYHRMRHEGVLRHLLLRSSAATGELLVAVVASSQADASTMQLAELTEKLKALPLEGSLAGVLHITNDSLADVVQSDHTEVLYGKDWITEKLLGLSFCVTLFSFFQTNSRGAELLYQTVRDYIGETNQKVIFDLYSGTGTIAQILAPVAKHVTGVEIVEEAVEAARVNAKLNGLDNCSFIAGDVLKVVDDLTEKPDLIVLDPPRDGIHPKALPKIIAFDVPTIVYVSCKPTSLVRDREVLEAAGYRMVKARAVDMFPATGVDALMEKFFAGEGDHQRRNFEVHAQTDHRGNRGSGLLRVFLSQQGRAAHAGSGGGAAAFSAGRQAHRRKGARNRGNRNASGGHQRTFCGAGLQDHGRPLCREAGVLPGLFRNCQRRLLCI